MRKIVALLTICSPLLINAQGFQVSLQGQKQQAMAGAGTALMADGAALFYNPGGVSFLKKNSVSFGVTPVISHAKYADESSSTVSQTNSPASFPFTAYMVFGKKASRLKYGMAVYTPFGSAIEWEKGWTGRFAVTSSELTTIYFQPTVSYKINEQVGIGAGFVYGYGKVNFQRDIPVIDNKGDYSTATLEGSGSGYGFNAGIYYKPSERVSFGLTYRSEVKMEVEKGKATFSVPASLATSFPNGNFSASVPMPQIITFGTALEPCSKLRFAFDASLIGWKSFDTLAFDYENNTPSLEDTKSPRNYKNAYSTRLGAEYSINSRLEARAGIKLLVSPIKDGYVTPEVPDATHVNYSTGLGYNMGRGLNVDLSFTFQSMKRKDTNIETQMNGTYKTYIFMPGISLNYNF